MNIIKILDIIAATLVVLSLFMVPKSYKWWLVYAVSAIFCTVVYFSKGLPGMTIMALVLLCVGLKNYFIGRRVGS